MSEVALRPFHAEPDRAIERELVSAANVLCQLFSSTFDRSDDPATSDGALSNLSRSCFRAMLKWGLKYVWIAIVLSVRLAATNESADSSPPAAPRTAPSVYSQTAITTCQSRTVNYITHTLPQQCLKTNWARSNSSAGTATSDPVSTAAHSTATSIVVSQSGGSDASTTSTASESGTPAESAAESILLLDSTASLEESSKLSTTDSTSEIASTPSPGTAADAENDSPLDIANFLSFEEWKRQNLAKVGQSPDSVGQGRSGTPEERRRPTNANGALDSLGDEGEIDLDFGAFVPAETGNGGTTKSAEPVPTVSGKASSQDAAAAPTRKQDAGVAYKERFNHASFDCAATVLKTNPRCKSPSSVLFESKDSYMLNECRVDNKFIIVELCDDILIDTVVLGNFEFFSSTFRTFRLSITDRYPVKDDRWKDLGTFEARNTRDIQVFSIENPLIWTRYLRIEFLTHYGSEYYCPVSLLRVYGTTMMEEFRHQEESSKNEDEVEEKQAEHSPSVDWSGTLTGATDEVQSEPTQNESSGTNVSVDASVVDVAMNDSKDEAHAQTISNQPEDEVISVPEELLTSELDTQSVRPVEEIMTAEDPAVSSLEESKSIAANSSTSQAQTDTPTADSATSSEKQSVTSTQSESASKRQNVFGNRFDSIIEQD